MRLGIRAKQIAGVTLIVGVFVVGLSGLYISQLAQSVLLENEKLARLLVKQIFDRAREVVPGAGPDDAYMALRNDPGIRSILDSTIYGENITGAAILDADGIVIASQDESLVGGKLPEQREELKTLVASSAVKQLRTIYSEEAQTFEVREDLTLAPSNTVFGSIHIGVSTLFVRDVIDKLLIRAVTTGAVALLVGVIAAAVLSQLLLKPIHVIRSGLTRLGKGEFGVTLDLPPGDEFSELGSFFNTVSQQLSADRSLLAGQKANLQSAVEHLEDAVALFDPSGQLLFSNPAMQPTLPADAIGRALQALLPNGHPYRGLVEETLATRASRGPVHLTSLQPQDATAESGDEGLLAMTHAVAATDGQLVGVLLVARNLAHLSRMQSTLAYSRKLVALGRLTAGIAHEVKNPLNAMMIHLELLRTKIRGGALAPARQPEPVVAGATLALSAPARLPASAAAVDGVLEHVEVIESEIRRLDEVVQGFLKFTRPEDLRLQPVRVSALFSEIMPVIDAEARKTGVRVVTEGADSAPNVNGDAAMLRQALLNLAINACQAMPNGGELRLQVGPESRGRVSVRVEDTGVGIPPENLEKIFDLYFTTKHHGTGIGLSMVYRIVQLHDGEVEVQSTPGRGTSFRLLLPRAMEQ
ncbi:MAG TPA: ATP-binding protein [Vicinamibacterales bacterium]|nr:ATP-binding protein [Vicinamibacterales bacterium]